MGGPGPGVSGWHFSRSHTRSYNLYLYIYIYLYGVYENGVVSNFYISHCSGRFHTISYETRPNRISLSLITGEFSTNFVFLLLPNNGGVKKDNWQELSAQLTPSICCTYLSINYCSNSNKLLSNGIIIS